MDVTGGMLDANPDLSICPEASQSFPGQPGLICRDALGRVLRPEFRFVTRAGTGDKSLCLTYADEDLGLTYEAHFELTASSNILTCWSRLEATQPLMLNWLAAPVFPATQLSDAMIELFRALDRRISDPLHPMARRHSQAREPHGPQRA